MNLTLQRDDMNAERAYGTMRQPNGVVLAETIERPWAGNQHDISCIPAGEYPCELRFSPKRGYAVYGVEDVPDRSDIEIHIANMASQVLGCIALGTVRGKLTVGEGDEARQVDAVLNSKVAFEKFMATMGVPHYELLTSDEAVRGYKLLHPDAGKFTLTILNAAADA